jgi:non-canonical purine NTP pyrophosphatase (RdgB/HAM1 family)
MRGVDFLFVTGSDSKAAEAGAIIGRPIERLSIPIEEIQASTIEEIARDKARRAHERTGRACVVEDAGLEFSAWGGLPGPYVKWFEKAGLEVLCRALDGFPDRNGRAVCALAYRSAERELLAVGRVEGAIAASPRGSGGFGWDAIFIPAGHSRTFGEMTADEKNAISHRRRAWEELGAMLGLSPRTIPG